MPNWFYFTVNVSGEKKDVEQFVENVKGSAKYGTSIVTDTRRDGKNRYR